MTARTDGGLTQFLVPADANGVTITPMKSVDLTRRFAQVRFDGVNLPSTAVVGPPGNADEEVERARRTRRRSAAPAPSAVSGNQRWCGMGEFMVHQCRA